MARKKKQKQEEEPEEEVIQVTSEEGMDEEKKKFFLWPLITVFALGFMLYVQTVNYQYALDDKLVITHNYITKKGFKGVMEHLQTDFLVGFFGKQKNLLAGGRYRPLSLVSFSIENQLFGTKRQNDKGQFIVDKDGDQLYEYNPFFGHLMNALMYAGTGVLLFLILLRILPHDKNRKWFLSLPFLATLLWVAHPLHTEVVANIKGRDEIMSLMLALASLLFSIKYLDNYNKKHLIWSGVCFFLAIMSKETAVNFVAVVPMTIYFFTKEKAKQNFMATLPLLITTAIYIIIRLKILGSARTNPVPELMNNPFMHANGPEKIATIFFTLGLYIKLLFFPHPLTHDYYPWHPLGKYIHGTGQPYPYLNWGDPEALLSLVAYGFLIYWGLKGLKTKSIWSYCILFYLGNLFLVSNLIFPVGTFLNERFMYVPSIGFTIMVSYFLVEWLPNKMKSTQAYTKVLYGTLLVLLTGYSLKTVSRNTSWKNDFALSVGDVEVSYKSAKSNMSAGLALVDESKLYKQTDSLKQQKMLNQAIKHLTLSLNIYPTYIQPMLIMGNAYYELEDYDNAIVYFEKCLKLNPQYEYAVKNLEHVGDLCVKKGLFKTGAKSYETLMRYDKTNAVRVYPKLGELYGKNLRDLKNAEKYLVMALQLKPDNSDVMQKLGVVYAMSGQSQKAIEIFLKALEKNPNNPHVLMNVGIAYRNIGNQELSSQYLNKAFEINPNLRKGFK